ncbi:hypothetical protein [Lysobacter gummosus]|uniref:hypothetical protein n=1 Tax=Lysobacter gummosus TaxID=262324 RepID=UPI00363BA3F4
MARSSCSTCGFQGSTRMARAALGPLGALSSNSYEETCARDYFEKLSDVCD